MGWFKRSEPEPTAGSAMDLEFKGGELHTVKADNATRVRRARTRVVDLSQAIGRLEAGPQTPRIARKLKDLRAAREANVKALAEISAALNEEIR